MLLPTSPAELQTAVRETPCLRPTAGRSKPALSTPPDGVAALDLSRLRGIIEYDPDEYTFTAYAGTPVAEVTAELARHGQYLPFDPLWTAQGATLGGVTAANTAGSGRYRYGGVRDFILGVRFVDGAGELVRSGGKVVKNSAGFDLPKFFVGSLGRYGVLSDLSFKVFPRPAAYTTLLVSFANLTTALDALFALAVTPIELDALDLVPAADAAGGLQLEARLGGLPGALPGRRRRLHDWLTDHTACQAVQVLDDEAEAAHWAAVNGCAWVPAERALVKAPLAPRRIAELEARVSAAPRRYTAGGNVAWIAASDPAALGETLAALGLVGLQLTGAAADPVLGRRAGSDLAHLVKQALDPQERFGPLW